jgi:hypothetical protein
MSLRGATYANALPLSRDLYAYQAFTSAGRGIFHSSKGGPGLAMASPSACSTTPDRSFGRRGVSARITARSRSRHSTAIRCGKWLGSWPLATRCRRK